MVLILLVPTQWFDRKATMDSEAKVCEPMQFGEKMSPLVRSHKFEVTPKTIQNVFIRMISGARV